MLLRSRKIDLALDLNNSKVLRAGGDNNPAQRIADYFRANNMKYTEMKFPQAGGGAQSLRVRQVRHPYLRRLPALRVAPQSDHSAERPCHPTRRDLEKEPLAPKRCGSVTTTG